MQSTNEFQIKELDEATYLIVFNTQKINILNIDKFKVLLDLLKGHGLILDFINVNFIDSSGFYLILELIRKSMINDLNLKFINTSPEVQELFELVGIDYLQ